jgi:hypothetical protein
MGVNVIVQAPVTIGARVVFPGIEEYPQPAHSMAAQIVKIKTVDRTLYSLAPNTKMLSRTAAHSSGL